MNDNTTSIGKLRSTLCGIMAVACLIVVTVFVAMNKDLPAPYKVTCNCVDVGDYYANRVSGPTVHYYLNMIPFSLQVIFLGQGALDVIGAGAEIQENGGMLK